MIHSTGILLEADYKGVVSGKESPIAGLQRAFSKTKQGARGGNPLERKPDDGEETLESGENDGQLTYELVNRDSGMYPHSSCIVCSLKRRKKGRAMLMGL